METPFLSIIIPAHNEALRLPKTLERVAEFVRAQSYPCEVLVVENGSKDDTAAIARAWQERLPELRVLSLEEAGKVRVSARPWYARQALGLAVKGTRVIAAGKALTPSEMAAAARRAAAIFLRGFAAAL